MPRPRTPIEGKWQAFSLYFEDNLSVKSSNCLDTVVAVGRWKQNQNGIR